MLRGSYYLKSNSGLLINASKAFPLLSFQSQSYAKKRKSKTKRPFVYKVPENEHMSYIYDIRNQYIEIPTNIPEPCTYTGNIKDLRSAYVLSRLPTITKDKHPITVLEERLSIKERNREARHSFADFWTYVEAWEKLFRARKSKLGGKKKKKADKGKIGKLRPIKPRVENRLSSWSTNKLLGRPKIDEAVLHFWNTFQPQMRYTQADFDDNRSTMQRKLMEQLYLIVYDESEKTWKFPDVKLQDRDTLGFAAMRQFHSDMGDSLFGYFDSNAPIGHVTQGDKTTFFMSCDYMTGTLPESYLKKYPKYAWVAKNELQDYQFPSNQYLERIQKMLK